MVLIFILLRVLFHFFIFILFIYFFRFCAFLGILGGVPGFLGVFLVFWGCLGFSEGGVADFRWCSGMFRRCSGVPVFLKVLHAFAGLYISSSPRAVATGSHHEKPILPKIMRQKSFNNYKPLNLNIHHTLKR